MTSHPSLFEAADIRTGPLAHRLRPRSLEEFLGQTHLLGPGKPLRTAIERGEVRSMVLWGPPGCGKTTLATLLAERSDNEFETFSAVTEGVPRVREIIAAARTRRAEQGRGTILFCDEIHRFNKAQQDAFLPSVEAGIITLIGATTENPSFELNSALLSRLRVFVLKPLDAADIGRLIERAWQRLTRDFDHSESAPSLAPAAVELLVRHSDGDGRRALNAVESVWDHAGSGEGQLDADAVAAVLERKLPRYDKNGEQHFNLISALHKAIRGSNVEGALYWLARMIDGGEDPLYIARRVVRMAIEDIGLADPRGLTMALAAKEAYQFLGSPEGDLAIAEAVIFLAAAPKSNRAYLAWGRAQHAAAETSGELVPLHIRNAPTALMSELGYGKGYRYDHDEGGHAAGQEYLPEALRGATWYEPTDFGFEKNIGARIARRAPAKAQDSDE